MKNFKYFACFIRIEMYLNFCIPELISICEMFNLKFKLDSFINKNLEIDPIIGIYYEDIETNDFAQKICDRSILTTQIIKLISFGNTFDELIEKINFEEFNKELESLQTFKIKVDAKNRSITKEEKLFIINKFVKLKFKGKVNLNNPKRKFIIIDNTKNGIKYFGKIIAMKSEGKIN